MIDQRDSYNLGRFFQALSHTDVLIAGRRITTRVIVQDENAVGGIADGRTKHFTRMHQTVPESSDGDLVTVNRGVLCVQCDDPELFLLAFTGKAAEPL